MPIVGRESTLARQWYGKCLSRNVSSEQAVYRTKRSKQPETSKIGLRQRLDRVAVACGDFEESRKRDAIYPYLQRVFGIVRLYRVKRRISKLCQRAAEYAGLSREMKSDPFTVVIRCTCDGALDAKSISRLSRA